jgi:hypothetical protein
MTNRALGRCHYMRLEMGSSRQVAHQKGAVGGDAAALRWRSGAGWPVPMARRAASVRVGYDDRGKENKGGWWRPHRWTAAVGKGWTKGTNKRAFL